MPSRYRPRFCPRGTRQPTQPFPRPHAAARAAPTVRQSARRRRSIRAARRPEDRKGPGRRKIGRPGKKRKRASASGRNSANPRASSMTWASRGCAMRIRAAISAGARNRWRKCDDGCARFRKPYDSALLAAPEFTAGAGIDETDHAFVVIGAGRLAERFPFFDALLLRRLVDGFLRDVARLVGDHGGLAGPAVELA